MVLFLALIMVLAGPALAEVKLNFYYPVGVAGPLVRVINTMVEKFNAENPGVTVVPVYAGNYNQTMQKVQTAVLGGTPPDIAVVEISEVLSLRAMDATIPLAILKPKGEKSFWHSFTRLFSGMQKSKGGSILFPSSGVRRFSTGTKTPSGKKPKLSRKPVSVQIGLPKPGMSWSSMLRF